MNSHMELPRGSSTKAASGAKCNARRPAAAASRLCLARDRGRIGCRLIFKWTDARERQALTFFGRSLSIQPNSHRLGKSRPKVLKL